MRLQNFFIILAVFTLLGCQAQPADQLESSSTTGELSGEVQAVETPSSITEPGERRCDRIIFSYRVAAENPQSDIVSICPDGTEKTRLTSNAYGDFMPAWSPDSSKIAFLSRRIGQPSAFRNGTEQLYLMGKDGENLRQITSGLTGIMDLIWLPDGSGIILQIRSDQGEETTDWHLVDPGTGETSLIDWLPDVRQLAFSHEGDRITYAAESPGNPQIHIRRRDGTGDRILSDAAWSHGNPAWSPDDGEIAFASFREGQPYTIHIVKPDSTPVMIVEFAEDVPIEGGLSDFEFDWAPDGGALIVRAGEGLHRLDLETGEQTTLFSFGEWPNEISHLDWLP